MSKLPLISPSSLKTYKECPRKWAWRKIDKVNVDTTTEATAKGSATHKILEDYLNDGTVPEPDPDDPFAPSSLARRAIDAGFLPEPGQAVVEGKFETSDWYTGFKDFKVRHSKRTQEDFNRYGGKPTRGRTILIGDHKTSSNPEAYALTEWELIHSDPQAIIYAYDEFQKDAKLKYVDMFWSYMQSKNETAYHPVFARVDRETNAEEIAKLHDTKNEMQRLMTDPNISAKDLPKNISACSAYGGCPYINFCFNDDDLFEDVPEPKKKEPEMPKQEEKLVVFLNCAPMKGPYKDQVQDFATFIAPLGEKVAKAAKKLHYKCIPFGEGSGLMAGALRKAEPKGVFRVERYSTDTAVLETLLGMADEVYG